MAEPVLVTEPTPPSPPTHTPPPPSGTASPGPGPATAQPSGTTPRPTGVPNARKGYKLTLWVSAATEAGLTDVHGLLQLDGADPTPFCQLKGVQNPLARALQEAYLAVERVRAKPPRMSAPAVLPATGTRQHRPSPPAPPTASVSPRRQPTSAATADAAPAIRQAPVAQPPLF